MCKINRELCRLNHNGRTGSNRKSTKSQKPPPPPGSDGINNELYKHVPKKIFFYINFWIFSNVCWIYGDIPEEVRAAIFLPIHKKRR